MSGREPGQARMSCVFIEVIYPVPSRVFMVSNQNRPRSTNSAIWSHCSFPNVTRPKAKLLKELSTVRRKSRPSLGIAKAESRGQKGESFPGTL